MLREKSPFMRKRAPPPGYLFWQLKDSVLGQLEGARDGAGGRTSSSIRGTTPDLPPRWRNRQHEPDSGSGLGQRANRGRLRGSLAKPEMRSTGLSVSHETSIHQHAPALTLSQTSRGPQVPPFHDERTWGEGRTECGEDDRRARAGQRPHPSRTPVSGSTLPSWPHALQLRAGFPPRKRRPCPVVACAPAVSAALTFAPGLPRALRPHPLPKRTDTTSPCAGLPLFPEPCPSALTQPLLRPCALRPFCQPAHARVSNHAGGPVLSPQRAGTPSQSGRKDLFPGPHHSRNPESLLRNSDDLWRQACLKLGLWL